MKKKDGLLPRAGRKVPNHLVDRTDGIAVELVAHLALHFQGDLVRVVDSHLLGKRCSGRDGGAGRLGKVDLQLLGHGSEEGEVGDFVCQRAVGDRHVDCKDIVVD